MNKRLLAISMAVSNLILLLVNMGHYFFGGRQISHWGVEYGIPFTIYEDVQALSRGRFLYLGLLANVAVASLVGIIFSIILNSVLRKKAK